MDSIEPVPRLNLNSDNLAEAWKNFRQNFEIYLLATESLNKPERVKVAILLNTIGPEAVKLYNTFNLTELEQSNMTRVIMEFEKYCTTQRRNLLYDTYLFAKRRQTAYESFDSFVNDLKNLIKFCDYENEERMLRDRIVFGAFDRELQKQYFALDHHQLDSNQAIEMGRAAEIKRMANVPVSMQQSNISMEPSPFPTQSWARKPCSHCNLVHPWNVRCPALGKLCKYCNRPNHYSGACRKKRYDDERLWEDLKARYGRMQI